MCCSMGSSEPLPGPGPSDGSQGSENSLPPQVGTGFAQAPRILGAWGTPPPVVLLHSGWGVKSGQGECPAIWRIVRVPAGNRWPTYV